MTIFVTVCADGRGDLRYLLLIRIDDATDFIDRINGARRIGLDGLNHSTDFARGLCGASSELPHLVGHHCEASTRLTRR